MKQIALIVSILILASCGGSDGSPNPSTTTTVSSSSPPTSTTSTPAPPTQSSSSIPSADGGYLVNASALSGLEATIFAGWNPSTADATSPGMKIMVFGSVNSSCSQTTGSMTSFSDSVLSSDGYDGAASVPTTSRYMPDCSDVGGPDNVFMDGENIWAFTSTQTAGLIVPFTSTGQNNTGANVNIIDTSVNYRLDPLSTPQTPWAANGTAALSSKAQVKSIVVGNDASVTVQAKQLIGMTLVNSSCQKTTTNLCQLYIQVAEDILQSDTTLWSSPSYFLDGAQGNLPVLDVTLIPEAGESVSDPTSGLSLLTSTGSATQHGTFSPTQFGISITFEQFENVVRILSALSLNQAVQLDSECAQCAQVFGSTWDDPSEWQLLEVLSSQEIYDATGNSAQIFGGYSWLYAGSKE